MSPPVGPTGLIQRCTGDDPKPPMNRISLGGGAFRTILLTGGTAWRVEQIATTLSYERRLPPKVTLSFSAGGVLGGRFTNGNQLEYLQGGAVGSAGVSYLFLQQKGGIPFVMGSGSFSFSVAAAQPTVYLALDVRAGVAAGYTLFNRLTLYLTGRLFGGPVFWNGSVGGDARHFQLGGGLTLLLPAGFDLYVEAIPLGEQRLSGGIGWSF